MKELHNDIFSTTECISKELLEKYAAKDVSKKELHQIQKHLLECDMCSDALDGLDAVSISPHFFDEVNREVDRFAAKNTGRNTRNFNAYLVAASVAVLCILSYFSYQFVNTSLDKNSDLAIVKEQPQLPASAQLPREEEPAEEALLNTTRQEEKDETKEEKKNTRLAEGNKMEINEEASAPMSDREENIIENSNKSAETKGVAVSAEDNDLSTLRKEDDREFGIYYETQQQRANASSTERNKGKNAAKKSESAAPTQSEESVAGMAYQKNEPVYKINAIGNYKVVDYTYEYSLQEEQLFDKKQKALENTPPQYPNKQAQAESEKEAKDEIIEITYQQTLENAIHLFDKQKFLEALVQFKTILVKHPSDVNALFYGALCHYHLQKYSEAHVYLDKTIAHPIDFFYQEAKWYKAQAYVNQKETKKAKALLKEIINTNGFYKNQASELLKTIE